MKRLLFVLGLGLSLFAPHNLSAISLAPCPLKPIDLQSSFSAETQEPAQNFPAILWANYVAEMKTDEEILRHLKAWNFESIRFLGLKNQGSSAYMVDGDRHRFLVFRGSTSLIEKAWDLSLPQVSLESLRLKGNAHSGMISALRALSPEILNIIKRRQSMDPKPLILSGHSLGGALSLLFALKLEEEGIAIHQVYTTGAPRIGNQEFYQGLDQTLRGRYFRLEDRNDYTVHIPPSKAAAASFAAVIGKPESPLSQIVRSLVEGLDYDSPLNERYELTESQPTLSNELLSDQNFWQSVQGELSAIDSLSDLIQLFKNQAERHPPQSYLCQYQEKTLMTRDDR